MLHDTDWQYQEDNKLPIRLKKNTRIFIPKYTQAKKILDDIKNSDRLTEVDSLLNKLKAIKKFYYPSLFKHDDGYKSSIGKRGWGWRQDYVNVKRKNLK